MLFDIYAFADYSGAASETEQRRRIAWCVDRADHGGGEAEKDGGLSSSQEGRRTTGLTRAELGEAALRLLHEATERGERVLLGFDHNYSFPVGFFEAAAGRPLADWRNLLHWLAGSLESGLAGTPTTPLLREAAAYKHSASNGTISPRAWAASINPVLAHRLGRGCGPFWGPHFVPATRQFPFAEEGARLPERRLTELRRPGMKSVYQLGGAGSVGLQSLYGIVHLHQLLEACRSAGIPLHVWPFDGWELPARGHVLAEVYPTICWQDLTPVSRQAIAREAADRPGAIRGAPARLDWADAIQPQRSERVGGIEPRRSDRADDINPRRSDRADAIACVVWARERDHAGTLASYFKAPPELSPQELKRASLEGWVLGAT